MTSISLQALGTRIKALRQAKGLTQAQLAERCGYEPLTVSRFERGTYAPGIDTLAAIAEVLGITMQDFFSESGDMQATPENIRHEVTDLIYEINDIEKLNEILNFVRKRAKR